MRQAELLRNIEDEARIEAEYHAPDLEDWVMSEDVQRALKHGKRNKPQIVAKSLPTRRRAA
jgi:hypothetical protein